MSPATPRHLDAATERVAVNLLRHLEWQPDGFSLVFLFADVGPSLQLADWLDERLLLQDRPLDRREAGDRFVHEPEAAVDGLMSRLAAMSALPGATWFAAQRHPSDAAWNRARRLFLARLNERRFLLERDLHRPLVLVLPADFRAEARGIAPDIWHVRALSEEARATATADAAPLRQPKANASRPSFDESAAAPWAAAAEWERTQTAGGGGAFLATAWRACEELLAAGRLVEAEQVAARALALARQRVARATSGESLADLSTSLSHVGRVAERQGRLPTADEAYRESLALQHQLAELGGLLADVPRGLPAALDNVGRIAALQGDAARAEQAYGDSLALRRQRAQRVNDAAARQDLIVALDNLAQVAETTGDTARAETLYAESLAVARRLATESGERTDTLDGLAAALDNIGRLAQSRGDWAAAEAAFRESLALRRRVADRLGGTPEALRELSVSLDALGYVMSWRGEAHQAAELFDESLALSRRLVERLGRTPEALRDLAISLRNAAPALGDQTAARALDGERLALARERLGLLGRTPELLGELCDTLEAVARAAMAERGDRAQAEALYRESLAARHELAALSDRAAPSLASLAQVLSLLGQLATGRGDGAEAEALYREALAVVREWVARQGETPEALDALAFALDAVGRAAECQGDFTRAEAAFGESLALRRRLADRPDGTSPALQALASALRRVGRVAQACGAFAEAEAVYRESLALCRRRVEHDGGETPQALEALAVALLDLANLPPGDAALRREATDIYEALAQRFPTIARFARAVTALRGGDNPPAYGLPIVST